MTLLRLVIFIVTVEVTLAQFNPSVTIDCLNGNGDVSVSVTSASTSGKVSLYVGNSLCAEQNTTTTSIVVNFTSSAGCPGTSTTYPTTGTVFYIYVTEGQRLQAGHPDELYNVTCNADNSESAIHVNVSHINSGFTIQSPVRPSARIDITDSSDNIVTSLVIGNSYKFKISCLDGWDLELITITADSDLTLIANGCTNDPSVFNNPTYPSQCHMEAVFSGFMVAGSAPPHTLRLDAEVQICVGNCTRTSCPGRRKRRGVTREEESIVETIHIFKEIVVYPKNETQQTMEKTTQPPSPTAAPLAEKCFSNPLVYGLIALLLVLTMVSVSLGVLLYLSRRSRSNESHVSHDSQEWREKKWRPSAAILSESSDMAARKY